jgi:thiamine-monophosphate kinase
MTVLGSSERPVQRSGAQPGDRLLLAGPIPGMAHLGLSLLSEPAAVTADPWSERDARTAAAQLRPRPPLGLGARSACLLTSLMDVSDGLVRDGSRLALASGAGLALDAAGLDREARSLGAWAGRDTGDPLHAVLYGGEDFGLLGTSPGDRPVPEGFRQIGVVVAGSDVSLGGRPLSARPGFDHFDADLD